jgi:type III secretion protein L
MEPQIIDLALKISAKIIGRDLQRDPMVVAEIAATAIETARASKAMVLRVNPKDGATLRAQKPKLMELIGRTVEVSIRDDADIEAGGCLIQTEFGTIDGQIKTQYDMLKNVLLPDTAKKEGPK